MSLINDLLSKPTYELISLYQGENSTTPVKEAAFVVLCNRFREKILLKAEVICEKKGQSVAVAEIITERTFRCYAKSSNFNPNKAKASSHDIAFELYLLAITRNELVNYFREEHKKASGLFYDGSEQIIYDLPTVDTSKLPAKLKYKYMAIASLPAPLRTIYLTFEFHERDGCKLPRKLLSELRNQLGIAQSTIRAYKRDAKEQVERYIEIMNASIEQIKTVKNG